MASSPVRGRPEERPSEVTQFGPTMSATGSRRRARQVVEGPPPPRGRPASNLFGNGRRSGRDVTQAIDLPPMPTRIVQQTEGIDAM